MYRWYNKNVNYNLQTSLTVTVMKLCTPCVYGVKNCH